MIQFDLSAAGQGHLSSQDALLIEGLRAGEEAAYEELVQRFSQPVYNLVYRLLNDPGETNDVVQEVFLKIFRSVGSFRRQSSLKTWIYRIAINETHNHRRWRHRRRGLEIGLEEEQGDGMTYEQVLPDTGKSPFELALDRESEALLEEALEQVKPAYRTALILRDVEGLTYEEIAEILDVSLGTVKSKLVRGREALKAVLAHKVQPAPKLVLAPQGAQS